MLNTWTWIRMGDRQVLLKILQGKMLPLLPTQGNQVGNQLRILLTMVRKFQWQMDIISSLLVREKQELKRRLTSNQKERVSVPCPKVELQVLVGLVLVLMWIAEVESTTTRCPCKNPVESVISLSSSFNLSSTPFAPWVTTRLVVVSMVFGPQKEVFIQLALKFCLTPFVFFSL